MFAFDAEMTQKICNLNCVLLRFGERLLLKNAFFQYGGKRENRQIIIFKFIQE